MLIDRFVATAILVIAFQSQAHAYIDPGTGSVVTTAVLGFFAAIAYTFRKYVYRLSDLISGKKAKSAQEKKRDGK